MKLTCEQIVVLLLNFCDENSTRDLTIAWMRDAEKKIIQLKDYISSIKGEDRNPTSDKIQ